MSNRFVGISRLWGKDVLARLQCSTVCIIGNGGVGSWAVESLARSGVGHLILIDGDVVAESNMNRQIQALDSNIGKPKSSVSVSKYAQTSKIPNTNKIKATGFFLLVYPERLFIMPTII